MNTLRKKPGFIIPIEAIVKMFRGKYMDALKRYWDSGKLLFDYGCQKLRNRFVWKVFLDQMYQTQWLPFVKETFNGNGNAIEYLARYAYRMAISNSRIISVDEENVSFRYTDYADGNKKKCRPLPEPNLFVCSFSMYSPKDLTGCASVDF